MMTYHWDWAILWQISPDGQHKYYELLLSGLFWTIMISLAAGFIALVMGSIIGVMRTLPKRWAASIAIAYVELFRNIPLLVQLFILYFVVPELLPTPLGLWIKQQPSAPIYTAIIGLGLFTSARIAEQIRSAIAALPRGQKMAGTALGLTGPQTYRWIILPLVFRIILGPLTSEFTALIKNSSVALTIGVLELTAEARAMQEFSFQVFEAFAAATLLYLLLNGLVSVMMGWLEHKLAIPGFAPMARK